MPLLLLLIFLCSGCVAPKEDETLELETKAKQALDARNYQKAQRYYSELLKVKSENRDYLQG